MTLFSQVTVHYHLHDLFFSLFSKASATVFLTKRTSTNLLMSDELEFLGAFDVSEVQATDPLAADETGDDAEEEYTFAVICRTRTMLGEVDTLMMKSRWEKERWSTLLLLWQKRGEARKSFVEET